MTASSTARRYLALVLCLICPASLTWAQQPPIETIAPTKASVPAIVRSYFPVDVPPVRLANSSRLHELVRAGTLYLTVQDAIALALENNIDIEVARYNPLVANWNVTRAQAGGALPGVPTNSAQVGATALGQGVAVAWRRRGSPFPDRPPEVPPPRVLPSSRLARSPKPWTQSFRKPPRLATPRTSSRSRP